MIAAVTTSGTTQALWYLTRATGLVSLVMLTLVMVLGVSQVQRWSPARWPRFVTATLHRNASLLAVVFLVIHILTAVLDPFAPIGIVAAVVPFSSPYRTLWLGLGAVAFDLIMALVITSLLRERVGYRVWRVVHWTAYLCWPIAFVHGLGTGSDGRVGWVLGVDAVCLAAIVASVIWRLAANWQLDPARRAVGALSSALIVVLVLGWAATGPTQPGWARKAGTPRSLLGSARSIAAGTASGPTTSGAGATPTTATGSGSLAPPVHAIVSGTIAQSGEGRRTTVTITGTLSSGASGQLQIVLKGSALDDGGLALREGTMSYGPASKPGAWSGPVTGLSGATVTAQVSQGGGAAATAQVQLQIDAAAQTVTGTLDVRQ